MKVQFLETKALEAQIDQFLDIITQGALGMKQALSYYYEGSDKEFADRIHRVSDLENQADDIRKRTETTLYTFSLIPESRGDVLSILENMDNVIDRVKNVLQRFDVEQPEIPIAYLDDFLRLTESTVCAVDNVVGAARAYFRDVGSARDFVNKVDFYESEADRVGFSLKKQIFSSDLSLSQRIHLRHFVDQIESISDIAENVAERIAIAAIKRTL